MLPTCLTCRWWEKPTDSDRGICRKVWPAAGADGVATWPRSLPTDSCSYHAAEGMIGGRSLSRTTNAEIISAVREDEPMELELLVDRLQLSGAPEHACRLRIQKMIDRELLVCRDGNLSVPDEEEKSPNPPGRPAEHDLADYLPVFLGAAPSPELALGHNKLFDLANEIIGSVGRSAFRRMLAQGVADGRLKLTEFQTYWVPDTSPQIDPP